MKRLALALLLLFTLPGLVLASSYTERLEHGRALVDELNSRRSPNLDPKYLLYKVADMRAEAQAAERNETGTSEFEHDLGPVHAALEDAGVCYHWVGETIGFSNRLDRTSDAAIADSIIDRWRPLPSHWNILSASSADWGGGGWVRSESGVYFFVMYAADICGV